MANLMYHRSRAYFLKPLHTRFALQGCIETFWNYRQFNVSSDGISKKARSTAEEFTRQAKKKAGSASNTAKEAWEGVKDAVTGESESKAEQAKEEFKDKVEKGNYDKAGRN